MKLQINTSEIPSYVKLVVSAERSTSMVYALISLSISTNDD